MKTMSRARASIALVLALATVAAAATPTGPLSVSQASQAELDKQLASFWDEIRPQLEDGIKTGIAAQSGQKHGDLTIDRLAVRSTDFAAPPRLSITPVANGLHHFLFFTWGTPSYGGEHVRFDLPRQGSSWRIDVDGHVTYVLDKKILFFHVKHTFAEDVHVEVSKIRASDELDLDTTDPAWPQVKKTGKLKLDFDLKVRTGNFLLNVLLVVTKPIVDLVLRHEIEKQLKNLDKLVATINGQPSKTPWGAGAPPRAPIASSTSLEKFALQCSDDLQTVQTPFGTVVAANMSDPTYGHGTPVSYDDYGDSAIWTGHYAAGESFRYAVTKDPRAQANALRTIKGLRDLLDADTPGDGYLARCLIPTTFPDAQRFIGQPGTFTTTLRGTSYVCDSDISRDQYLGVMHGLGTAYDFLDDPATKQLAASLAQRIVDRLSKDRWCGMAHDHKTVTAPFVQSPEKMIAFSAIAARTDARFQPMRDELGRLAGTLWFFDWTGTLDPLNQYYKWNLGYGAMYHAMRLETDPTRFQQLMRAHAIDRRAIGHHENAYFQSIDVAVERTIAPQLAPLVQDELARFATLRPRRGFTINNSSDPTIARGTYTASLSFSFAGGGTLPSGIPTVAPNSYVVAKYPIAVEKRPSTDFLWQRSPFGLDGSEDPHRQPPGVDMVLPYWMGRYYGIVH